MKTQQLMKCEICKEYEREECFWCGTPKNFINLARKECQKCIEKYKKRKKIYLNF